MPAIVIKSFSGLKPILDPLLLGQGEAQTASNVRLISGALTPLKGLTTLRTVATGTQTLARYGAPASEDANWLTFPGDVDVISSPTVDDQWSRVYWTDGATPKYAPASVLPGVSYTLGIPKPATKPVPSSSEYGKASVTISSAQIAGLTVGGTLAVSVDGGTDQILVLTGSGGVVTAETLSTNISTISSLTAVVDAGSVKVSTVSQAATSAITIKKKTGEKSDYLSNSVTYTNVYGPASGTNAGPDAAIDPADPAVLQISSASIAATVPGTRYSVKVNSNADVVITVPAGVNTFPEAVTATSLKSALSTIPALTVTLNDGTSQTLTVKTSATGAAAFLQIRKINPVITPIYVELVTGSNAASAALTEIRTYVYTYVSAYEEEGPPSDASSLVTVGSGQSVSLVSMATAPTGNYNISKKRIYRSSAAGSSLAFQFVAEIPVAQTTYTDSKTQAELGESLASDDWSAPPSGLKGLKLLSTGAAIGFKDNTAYLSEPFLPHAWPHRYPVEEKIVGLGVMRQSAVLLTDAYPYLMSGADPSAMSVERLELPQACVSKRSIVDTGEGVLYASPDGLVSISSAGMDLATKNLMTREQWQAYNPSSIVAAVHDNRYHAFYTTTGGQRGVLVFDFSGQGAAMTTSDISDASAVTAAFSYGATDTLYLVQGTSLVRFNAGADLTYNWKSKKFRAPYHMNFGKAQLVAAAYPVTFKLYGDGTLRFTKSVQNSNLFHLPGGFRALDYEIELSGASAITQVSVVTSADELRQS